MSHLDMIEIQGRGKKEGNKWKEEMEMEGLVVKEIRTTDNYWGYRPIRAKEGVVASAKVWASKNTIPGLWYYAIHQNTVLKNQQL